MFNYFIVEIRGKNLKYFLNQVFKLRINIFYIKYFEDRVLLKVSYDDYRKIKSLKTSYSVSIIRTSGSKRFLDSFFKYKISIITFVISFLVCLFLSFFTLFIYVDTDNSKIDALIRRELRENGVTIFSCKKSYDELNKIKNKIKNNNLDTIEWIEIENKGVVTKVKLILRVNDNNRTDLSFKDIVASRNGYIRKISSSSGDVLKSPGDYVRRGEVIISGNIFRNGDVVSRVKASGKVYAEVWYIVKLNKPFKYVKDNISSKGYFKVVVKVLGREFCIFRLKKDINTQNNNVIFNSGLFSISFKNENIHYKSNSIYSDRELSDIIFLEARDSVLDTLGDDEYIILEKTLKKYKYNGKMYVEIFLKTYEDIAEEKDIQKIINKKEKDEE